MIRALEVICPGYSEFKSNRKESGVDHAYMIIFEYGPVVAEINSTTRR
jgi:hypothetical protein